MQDLIRPDSSISPREIFARMQGAWFEPRIGSMWQENTGITPTTSGGQTVGLVLDQSQGAVLGPDVFVLKNNSYFDVTVTAGQWYTSPNAKSLDWIAVPANTTYRISTVSGTANRLRVQYQLQNDTYTSVSELLSPGVEWTNFVLTTPSSAKQMRVYFNSNTASATALTVQTLISNHAFQATAANRPTLQFNGNLPLIRFNSNNVLTASLPAINVRRNLLTYSEQFDNAAWVIVTASIASVDGAFKLTPNNITANSGVYHGTSASNPSVVSIYAKKAEFGYLQIVTGPLYANFDLNLGVVGSTNAASSITPMTDGWYRCAIYGGSAIYAQFSPVPAATAVRAAPISGNGVNGLYLNKAQLELGSVATEYQKITDWTSEAYSSSGSTYFATPQGMSCLHNQSIGTSYNLPALQTDNYCTVITPARLPPPLEQRLALYMHRLAGLSDADFFWQEQATDGMTGQLLADDGTILLRD